MPPPVSSKGKAKSQSRDVRTSRSRNTTPIPPGNVQNTVEPTPSSSYLRNPSATLSAPIDTTLEEILGGGSPSNLPSVAALKQMQETIQSKVLQPVQKRGIISDRLLREVSKRRSLRDQQEREREREKAEREVEEKKHKLKKVSKKRDPEDRPLAVGAHHVARQDGVDVHKETSSTISSPISQAPPSATGTGPVDAPSPSLSDASHQPAPAPAIPQYQTFGPDPSTFDDPTIYHIRDTTNDMTEAEKREIYCVADYPETDLHDQTPGTPPDKDFSNAKPASQVTATQFSNYVEPFIRPLIEEDVAFLRERGDRVQPFMMPRRGLRPYKEVWAEEDGAMVLDHSLDRLPPNEPRGSMENMTDELAETDEISAGPLLARLMATLRPEGRISTTTNGDANGDSMDIDESTTIDPTRLASATQMAESLQNGWKAPPAVGKLDFASLEDRALAELRHIGFLGDQDQADYNGHFDDEVAARLRYLQDQLRRQSIINGARKARILELTEERMAQQEYNTIADDLDNQLNAAYLKRNRNIGKGKKNAKRPGGPGGGSHPVNAAAGVSRPSVGEPIRTLMERKSQWNHTIGPVVDYGKTGLPKGSVFEQDVMRRLEDREQEMWNEVED
ncbi:hypothetical protein BU16DRAFT_583177 [Lophium mytilinum]|uniref:Transcriptional regulator Ngg1 n=1 Tax=Lophium mytilinum TaxID=390894 RepID=A0A6A6QQC9_9PEZI|nr:hypothetical protein BU16DRAFT_583177 [Lophium mytilinum]